MAAMALARPRSRRSSELIVSEIIRAAISEVRKTKLMYASSLNVKQLNKYLETMIGANLLSHDPSTNTYVATERARAYLQTLADLQRAQARLEKKRSELNGLLQA
jgi:predicted transcriptional regulator